MNIGNIPYHAFPSIGYAISAAVDGRMSVPVVPSQMIYAHFKHVSGTPAPEGTTGANVSKLKILNTLIDQQQKMKKQPEVDFSMLSENDENRISMMIEQYQQKIKAVQSTSFYTPAPPPAGLLFNIAA
jgi:hypothetical protein